MASLMSDSLGDIVWHRIDAAPDAGKHPIYAKYFSDQASLTGLLASAGVIAARGGLDAVHAGEPPTIACLNPRPRVWVQSDLASKPPYCRLARCCRLLSSASDQGKQLVPSG